jgi:hypothetical protein
MNAMDDHGLILGQTIAHPFLFVKIITNDGKECCRGISSETRNTGRPAFRLL